MNQLERHGARQYPESRATVQCPRNEMSMYIDNTNTWHEPNTIYHFYLIFYHALCSFKQIDRQMQYGTIKYRNAVSIMDANSNMRG